MRPTTKLARRALAVAVLLPLLAAGAWAQPAPPAAGADPIVDRIRKNGLLRAAAIGEVPWLPENTSGSGEQFSGPAWLLAKEYARLLGVRLEPVAVSHETKVPILASGQADITIAPLSETPARDKVIDFVVYSKSALCLFGRADNAKLKDAKTVDDLDKANVTLAYFTGTPPETWVPQRFHALKTRAVAGSGANAPVEEIMSGRADIAPIDAVAWPQLQKAVPGLAVWPQGDACLQSSEMATPVGMGVDKGHPVYLAWLRAVADSMQGKLQAEELRIEKAQ